METALSVIMAVNKVHLLVPFIDYSCEIGGFILETLLASLSEGAKTAH